MGRCYLPWKASCLAGGFERGGLQLISGAGRGLLTVTPVWLPPCWRTKRKCRPQLSLTIQIRDFISTLQRSQSEHRSEETLGIAKPVCNAAILVEFKNWFCLTTTSEDTLEVKSRQQECRAQASRCLLLRFQQGESTRSNSEEIQMAKGTPEDEEPRSAFTWHSPALRLPPQQPSPEHCTGSSTVPTATAAGSQGAWIRILTQPLSWVPSPKIFLIAIYSLGMCEDRRILAYDIKARKDSSATVPRKKRKTMHTHKATPFFFSILIPSLRIYY